MRKYELSCDITISILMDKSQSDRNIYMHAGMQKIICLDGNLKKKVQKQLLSLQLFYNQNLITFFKCLKKHKPIWNELQPFVLFYTSYLKFTDHNSLQSFQNFICKPIGRITLHMETTVLHHFFSPANITANATLTVNI